LFGKLGFVEVRGHGGQRKINHAAYKLLKLSMGNGAVFRNVKDMAVWRASRC